MKASEDCRLDELEARMKRQTIWLRISGVAWASIAILFLLGGSSESPGVSKFDTLNANEINVSKINVVEPNGVTRLVIANSAQFPEVVLAGKTYPRKYKPAGIVFYDAKGSEMGGLALTDAEGNRVGALVFDYPNFDAIGMRSVLNEDGTESTTGLVINSRPPANLDALEASKVVHKRIEIQNRNENAEILMCDQNGRERLRFVVDQTGEPRIEMLDEDGKVRVRLPEG